MSKTLFIGSFPKETKGGSSTACLLLLESKEFAPDKMILLDSTLESISNNLLTARIWRATKRFAKLVQILVQQRPKNALITCGHGWSFVEKGLMLLFLRVFGCSSVITPNSGLILQSLKNPAFRWFTKRTFRRAKYVVCQGQFWKKQFEPYVRNPNKLQIVKNWISDANVDSPLPSFVIKSPDTIELAYIGWLEEYKGLDELIEAVKLCKLNGQKIHLDLWGDGSYKKQLIQKIDDADLIQNIHLKGWATEKDKKSIYKNQSILILPSHFEGMPNVILEAFANGLPVIASNISTIPEMITPGKNGLLFEAKNIHSLANAITQLGNDVLLQKSFRENAKETLESYRLENASTKLHQLLHEVKAKVLMLTDWFPPAYRAGGPIKSCDNIVKSVGSEVDIRVITSINDLGNVRLQVPSNTWTAYQNSMVYYAKSMVSYTFKVWQSYIFWRPNKIHINGVFSLKSSILPLVSAWLLGIRRKVILSLRGMLMPSAIHIKSQKKRAYLRLGKFLGLFKNILIHTTNEDELELSRSSLTMEKNVIIPNLPEYKLSSSMVRQKLPGELDIVIVGRVHQIKNIHLLPKFLKAIDGHTRTTLIGHLEDNAYLKQIEKAFEQLPNHEFRYLGEVSGNKVKDIIRQNHVLFLASQSENYGHAIVEALSSNCPVIISNTTPWENLEKYHAGFSIALNDNNKFETALQHFVKLDSDSYRKHIQGAKKYTEDIILDKQNISKYLKLYTS